MKRQLVLEDGSFFIGEAFGSTKKTVGEVVFNTGMTGYQEILTDPSYCGQIVTMTYPLIGNYGINRDDFESIEPHIHGFIVKEVCDVPSNWRSEMTLDQYLKEKQIPGLSGIDTRKLTRIIRQYGTLKGMICDLDVSVQEAVESLRTIELPRDQVKRVSTKSAYPSPGRGYRVVLVDFGMKHGILRELNKRNCDVIVLPYNATAEDVLRLHPDGVMLSNGPGDPKDVPEAITMIRGILGKVPLFGICLGHQLFALACGADTEKMKFGHRGSNHPVKHLATGKVAITSQNHGYTVKKESLRHTRLKITHTALNDGTIEGLRHLDYPAFTVQYHPEASPGPEDDNSLFDEFIEMIREFKKEGEIVHA
ncbi:carbamoyl phosphate synthase small subunit [Parageobacillus thermoglucosidasius]|uniref:Carbamoyl phosphate synthase small chain n=1 Tax=Parageobacillus thermoglucosidasius TaxID=1426 RepID=A0AAN1D6M5_PARTM|nr:carbamoyl phosphate synthase small subunit [Parageobacillus thermoglucosidasius]KYD14869.1 Carbamoyl-phosphate synthase small chain [Anoxybacillus flavithermus]REK54979.1 MAG: carbamoyl-phosphate synthase small subunit [Geobacillus sp.]ALF10083.1 carbamoyl phosphate synthase small subunit [Parageobacillus thermoglucosidasius]ANZ30165.1 carbamoyl phosphate synthase small subunit [Parageobacillus thermoglucosidasius]APM80902.1 carbamoyl phosphate synthase small subunit [Parageobacillus thermo